MGAKRVPWFGDWRRLASRKIHEFPRRNAKTRWDEPAGQFALSHLAVACLVEAGGIEPPSRDISMTASTCVVDCLSLTRADAYRQGFRAGQPGANLISCVPGAAGDGPELRLAVGRLRRTSSARAALFRLPLRDLHLQLSFLVSF